MQRNYDFFGEALIFFVMLVVFLAHKQRWNNSTFLLTLAVICAIASLHQLWAFLGPRQEASYLLGAYPLLTLGCVVLGIRDLAAERAALAPFVRDREVVPNWADYVPDDDKFTHG